MIVECIYKNQIIDIPEEILYNDYWEEDGIKYARIDGHENYYITSYGDVISFMKKRPRIMKTYTNRCGHRYVDLKDGGINKVLVHRLVAEAFIPNPNNYPIVRHLNDIPGDDRIENLAWGTPLMNHEDMIRNGHDYKRGVYCFELDKHFESCLEASEYMNMSKASITINCKGKTKTCGGYHFCYEDDLEEKLIDREWRMRKADPYKPLVAISATGERRKFGSRKEASSVLGIPDSGISSVISGRIKQTHGWRFEDGE